jgi:hypothetical protein
VKDAAERPPQMHEQNIVAYGSHLAVAGDDPDPIDGVQVLRFLATPLVRCLYYCRKRNGVLGKLFH